MKKFLKGIGILGLISGTIGLIFSMVKAFKLKNDDKEMDFLEADEQNIVKKCIFDELKDTVEMEDKSYLFLIGRFSGMELELTNLSEENKNITIDIDLQFGGIELKVPNNYKVVGNVSSVMGGVDIPENQPSESEFEITLTGKVLFGGVEVEYLR